MRCYSTGDTWHRWWKEKNLKTRSFISASAQGNIAKAAPDSLEKYGNLPFQTQTFIYINDAMEMLKTSSLMSAIRDKELATQIIKTYNAIKGSYETFNSFMEIKQKKVDKLINKPEVQKFLTNDADYSTAEEWTFSLNFRKEFS